MALSVFDLFKIGIGPSSSHTVGPMRAAHTFIQHLQNINVLKNVTRIQIDLYGACLLGRGHATDRAIMMGLMGETPEQVNTETANYNTQNTINTKIILLVHQHSISFDLIDPAL